MAANVPIHSGALYKVKPDMTYSVTYGPNANDHYGSGTLALWPFDEVGYVLLSPQYAVEGAFETCDNNTYSCPYVCFSFKLLFLIRPDLSIITRAFTRSIGIKQNGPVVCWSQGPLPSATVSQTLSSSASPSTSIHSSPTSTPSKTSSPTPSTRQTSRAASSPIQSGTKSNSPVISLQIGDCKKCKVGIRCVK